MRVTCSANPDTCHWNLIRDIKLLGIRPFVNQTIIRAFYDGPDHEVGEELVLLFSQQPDHEIHVDQYSVPKKDENVV